MRQRGGVGKRLGFTVLRMCSTRHIGGSLIPARLEKYLVDYTTLSRRLAIDLWRKGKITYKARDAIQGGKEGRFMSDHLVFEGDEVLLAGHNVVPSGEPLLVSAVENGFNYTRRTPPPPWQTLCIALHKPAGVVVQARVDNKAEFRFVGDILARTTGGHRLNSDFFQDVRQAVLHRAGVLNVDVLPALRHDPTTVKDALTFLQLGGFRPIGRLDEDSSGLLLLTNDGDFLNAVADGGRVEKEYHCSFRHSARAPVRPSFPIPHTALTFDEDDPRLSLLRHSIELPDGPARATAAAVLPKRRAHVPDETQFREEKRGIRKWRASITVTEGRNRLVRRMCAAACMGELQTLQRVRIGSLRMTRGLGISRPGSAVLLRKEQVEALWQDAGGRAVVREGKLKQLEVQAKKLEKLGRPDLNEWLRHARQDPSS